MQKEVAVFVGPEGNTVSLGEAGHVVVYKKDGEQWTTVRALSFSLEGSLNLRTLRFKMQELTDFLGGCRIFAALSIAGLPYFELERAGFKLWELQGDPCPSLQMIIDAEEESLLLGDEPQENPEALVEEISPGHIRVSLKEIQGIIGGSSSKQILLPILGQGRFRMLEIICDHLPPWLETKMMEGELHGTVGKNAAGETKITIFP